ADDYVTKPFNTREVIARMKAVLRRAATDGTSHEGVMEGGGIRLDPQRREVSVEGQPVKLTLKEFDVLELLMGNPGRVLQRETLIGRVWGSDYFGDTRTLDVHIKRLRAKLEPNPHSPTHLQTVRGVGYKFVP
ncbi:MAG: winged helix-turn-helix domain-containing protein, partial [Actinomycetota bacterium]